jgi:hypothetical protein
VTYLNNLPLDEDVLVLHFKTARGHNRPGHQRVPSIPNLIKRHRLDPNDPSSGVINPGRLKFTHWPAKATNKFRHIKHVIAAGVYFLPDPVYEAIARAAVGMKPEEHPEQPEELAKVIKSVDQGNLFQGVLRIAARLSDGPGCRPCDALVIGSSRRGIAPEVLAELFPGAPVIGWHPGQGDGAAKTFNGRQTRVQQAIGYLKDREGRPQMIAWSELRAHLGNPSNTYLHGPRLRRHPEFESYCDGRWAIVEPTRTGIRGGTEGGLRWIAGSSSLR